MRATSSPIVALALLGLALPACGNFSVPRVAANGTTIMIAVPDGFNAGFGRALNNSLAFNTVDPASLTVPVGTSPTDPNYYFEDFQQGELLFALREGQSESSPFVAYLPVRYITRVHVDESSGAALPAAGEEFVQLGTPVERGQVVAFVDIPCSVEPNEVYYIFMERWKRGNTQATATHFFEQSPVPINTPAEAWLSWAGFPGVVSTPTAGMEIRIVESSYPGPGCSLFSDTGWGFDKFFGNYSWRDFTADLGRLSPRAKLRLYINNPYPQGGEPGNPAAWEWTIQYPAGKVEITGAELGSLHRSGGFASVTPSTGSTANCEDVGTAKISVVDPDQTTMFVNVTYRLRSFPECPRAVLSDFSAAQGQPPKAYDVSGSPITPAVYVDPSPFL
jgi:hypothetical protein